MGALAAAPVSISIAARPVSAAADSESVATFFAALEPLGGPERNEAVLTCARQICLRFDEPPLSTGELGAVDNLDHQVRRIRFAIRALNEAGISTAIDERMVQRGEVTIRNHRQLIPLIGSLNNLRSAACAFHHEQTPDNAHGFLVACLAFGLEVFLWQSNVPYQMAWRQTRFISNRTFLRYARHGCRSCIALAMSELHWALRAVPYVGLDVDRVRFIQDKLRELSELADEINYEAQLDHSVEELYAILDRIDAVEEMDLAIGFFEARGGVGKEELGLTALAIFLIFILFGRN